MAFSPPTVGRKFLIGQKDGERRRKITKKKLPREREVL